LASSPVPVTLKRSHQNCPINIIFFFYGRETSELNMGSIGFFALVFTGKKHRYFGQVGQAVQNFNYRISLCNRASPPKKESIRPVTNFMKKVTETFS
jgi:hypothetical protein